MHSLSFMGRKVIKYQTDLIEWIMPTHFQKEFTEVIAPRMLWKRNDICPIQHVATY